MRLAPLSTFLASSISIGHQTKAARLSEEGLELISHAVNPHARNVVLRLSKFLIHVRSLLNHQQPQLRYAVVESVRAILSLIVLAKLYFHCYHLSNPVSTPNLPAKNGNYPTKNPLKQLLKLLPQVMMTNYCFLSLLYTFEYVRSTSLPDSRIAMPPQLLAPEEIAKDLIWQIFRPNHQYAVFLPCQNTKLNHSFPEECRDTPAIPKSRCHGSPYHIFLEIESQLGLDELIFVNCSPRNA
mmetsp:Transcript_8214/g.12614  ORF Transcript_8214/g.12614 Transcript_8214/m.12614 type:complete len:240 (-) Transcript_8214:114-833(-)